MVDGPLDGPMEVTLDACRCAHLNVVSGPVAREQLHTHLQPAGVDGMGRRIHRCPTAGIEWIEERQHVGYGEDVAVLRRRSR